MKGRDFTKSITVPTSAKKAYADICRVSQWWASSFEGSSREKGDRFTIRFGEVWVSFTVVDAVPDAEIVWEVTDCHLAWLSDKTEWKDTKIRWTLAAHGDSTQIRFTHVGLVPELECFKDCSVGWSDYLDKSLFKLVTENTGLPDQF